MHHSARLCSLGVGLQCAVRVARCDARSPRRQPRLAEGLRNEIKAHETYAGRLLRVAGTVEHRGLQRFAHTEASVGPYVFGVANATVRRVRTTYAYVLLLPTEASRGRLICYFDPRDRGQAGELEPGQRATLIGVFNRYRREPVGLVAQLDHCDVER